MSSNVLYETPKNKNIKVKIKLANSNNYNNKKLFISPMTSTSNILSKKINKKNILFSPLKTEKKILLTDVYSLSSSRNNSISPGRNKYLKIKKRNHLNNDLKQLSVINKTSNNTNYYIDLKQENQNNKNENYNFKTIETSKRRKSNNTLKLERFMREKLYIDVEKRMENNLKKKDIEDIDKKLLNRFIYIKQVLTFWKGISDFIHPILSVEKYKENNSSIRNFSDGKENNFKLNNVNKVKKFPRILSNFEINNRRHKEILNQKINFYNKINKDKKLIEDSIY